MKGKIYKLIDPRDNKIRYIGQTTKDLNKRFRGHMNDSLLQKKDFKKCKWIRKLVRLGLLPIIELIEEVDISILDDREEYWIKYYLDLGNNLTNTVLSRTDMCKKILKYRKSLSNKPVYGFNKYTGEIISFKSLPDAYKKINSKSIPKAINGNYALKNYYWSYVPFNKDYIPHKSKSNRPVKLTNINGKSLKFKSLDDAIRFTNGDITKHKNGSRGAIKFKKFYRGYYWEDIKGPLYLEQCEFGEFRETPEMDNPDPSSMNDNKVIEKEQRLMSEESTNNLDTSAEQSGFKYSETKFLGVLFTLKDGSQKYIKSKIDDIV